jgi:hypothetical protein
MTRRALVRIAIACAVSACDWTLTTQLVDARASSTALARAIVESDVDAVKRMVAEDEPDFTAQVTAAGETLPLVRLAVDVASGRLAGVNVDAGDARALEVVRLVFGAGADPNYSWTESAGESSFVTRYLVERAVGENPALLAVFVEAGLDVKSPGVGEALITASERGWTDTVRLLVDKGADVNHQQRQSKRTPLSEAVHRRHLAIIEILERAGAREW